MNFKLFPTNVRKLKIPLNDLLFLNNASIVRFITMNSYSSIQEENVIQSLEIGQNLQIQNCLY